MAAIVSALSYYVKMGEMSTESDIIWFLSRFEPLVPDTLNVICIITAMFAFGLNGYLIWDYEVSIIFAGMIGAFIIIFGIYALYVDCMTKWRTKKSWHNWHNKETSRLNGSESVKDENPIYRKK